MAITKVTNSLVAVNAIAGTLIADNAITSVHIAQNQVTAVQIPDGSITSTQLAANSVDTAELISGSIDAIHLASDSVITAKILNANVTTAKIANNAITSALIPDGSITNTQLGSGAFTMGTITTTGQLRGPASLTIDPATVGDNTGTVVIAGNLQVDGTTTTINSTTLNSADKNITLGFGANASANNGGGITIAGADATILYTHSGTKWSFNKPLDVTGAITASSLDISGAIDVDGTTNLDIVDIDGAVNMASTLSLGGDISMNDNQIIFNNNSQAILIKDAAGTASYVFYQDNADTLIVGNGTNVEAIRFDTGGNEGALTIDTSGNSTFGGAITSTGLNSTSGTVQYADGGSAFDSSDAGGYPRFTVTNGSAQIGLFRSGSSAGGSYIGADSTKLLRVYNSSFASKFDIDTSGNVTVVGNITTTAEIAGGLFKVGSTTVIDGSRNLTNIGTIGSGAITNTNTSGLGIQTSGYSFLSAANNARAASGSLRLGNGAGSTGLVIDYTDQGQTVATIRNTYAASNTSELTIQSPFITFDTGTSYTEALKLDHNQNATFAGTIGSGAIGITSNTPVLTFIESDQSNKQYQIGSFGAAFAINDASNSQFRYILDTNGNHIFNEGGANCDFRVESDGNANMLFVDGGTNRVGIGTGSPTDPLTIHDATPSIKFKDTSSNGEAYWALDGVNMSFFNKSTGGSMAFGSVNTERMRLLATGELHVTSGGAPISPTFKHEGATGDVAKIRAINRSGQGANKGGALELGGIVDDGVSRSDVFGAVAGLKTNSSSNNKEGYMAFYTTNNSALNEQMRIDSSGNATFGKNEAAVSTAGFTIGSPSSGVTSSMPSGNTYHVYKTGSSAGYKFYVSNLGVIHSTQTTINGLSDERLKENIADLETGLSEVMALKPRRFDWKNGDGKNLAGFIAQEVETVLPDLIGNFKHEELEDCKSLKMGDMVPTLVKAIQELTTKVKELEDKLNG